MRVLLPLVVEWALFSGSEMFASMNLSRGSYLIVLACPSYRVSVRSIREAETVGTGLGMEEGERRHVCHVKTCLFNSLAWIEYHAVVKYDCVG